MSTGVILARLQPIHNGHLALIRKALKENDNVLVLVGSADKFNKRNPIPISLRLQLANEACNEMMRTMLNSGTITEGKNLNIVPLDDLTNESDNTHDWGFYLYTNIVNLTSSSNFTIYYSDGFEIITTWFPSFVLRNNVSLSLLARNSVQDGISATKVRNLIMSDDDSLQKVVPKCVYEMRNSIKLHIETAEKM